MTTITVISEELPDGMLELDERDSGDVIVTLGWVPEWQGTVLVISYPSGQREWTKVDATLALDAFRHPFCYIAPLAG